MDFFLNLLIPVIKPLFLENVVIQAYTRVPTDNEKSPNTPLVKSRLTWYAAYAFTSLVL